MYFINTKERKVNDGYYDLDDFIASCKLRRVIFSTPALCSAQIELHLKTEKEILEFISKCKKEAFNFIKTDPSVLKPDVLIDIYCIKGISPIYLAIHFNYTSHRWTIKSFKRDTSPAHQIEEASDTKLLLG